MCGIFGFADLSAPLPREAGRQLRRMGRVLAHRGPDGTHFKESRHASIGVARLAVIDIEHGRQPASNEDGSVWAALNGEIYNYEELRVRLESAGHRFRSNSDTEVLAHLYEEESGAFVDALRGMFAIAIWDERRRRLLLLRDRFGVKPLYYATVGSRLLFASEIKALLTEDRLDRSIDPLALDHYFAHLATPGARTIYRGVHKLPPATRLIADCDGVRTDRYWRLPRDPEPPQRPVPQLVEELHAEMRTAVRLRMNADVPIGAFLSGGIDTSAIVALMAGLSSEPVRTFSLGFADPAYDESADARRMADHVGSEHVEVRLPRVDADMVRKIAWHFDEPFGDTSALPTYVVSQAAREHVTVVMSGDGGDEIFAGYPHHIQASSPDRQGRKKTVYHEQFSAPERRFLYSDQFFSQFAGGRLGQPYDDLLSRRNAPADPLRRRLGIDLEHFLPDDMLTKVDRMSMAWGLEVRSPFLDHRLAEFVWRLPSPLKIHGRTQKYLLKRAIRHEVPARTLRQRKRGFALAPGLLATPALRPLVEDLLSPARVRRAGLLRPAFVEAIRTAYFDRVAARATARVLYPLELRLWLIVCFELWRDVCGGAR